MDCTHTDEGTEFDLARQPAAGPFGSTDRYDVTNSGLEGGAFERPIGVYRTAYSYVGVADATQPVLYFAPHAAQTALYLPVLCGACADSANEAAPDALGVGTMRAIERASAYWAFRRVKHTAKGLAWNLCLEMIRARQAKWEQRGMDIVDATGVSADEKAVQLRELARNAVADWWALDDELILRFGDGYEHEWAADGSSRCKPLAYATEWLRLVGFVGSAPPPATRWTVERKRELRQGKAKFQDN